LLRDGDVSVKKQLVEAMFWKARLARPAIVRHAVAPLSELVESIAAGESLSDVAAVTRDLLRDAVRVLEGVEAVEPVLPALEAIVAKARGELRDQHLRDELARTLAQTRRSTP